MKLAPFCAQTVVLTKLKILVAVASLCNSESEIELIAEQYSECLGPKLIFSSVTGIEIGAAEGMCLY